MSRSCALPFGGPLAAAFLAAALAAGCAPPASSAAARPEASRSDEPPDPGTTEATDDLALSRGELARAAYAAGIDAEFGGDYAAAAECYRRAAGLEPAEPTFQLRLGTVLIETPETAAEGAAHLQRAEALGSRSFHLYQALANYSLQAGDKARAAREFEKLLECSEALADPERFEPVMLRVVFFLTAHYQAEGLPGRAAGVYGRIIAHFPERTDLRLERAKLWLAAGDEVAARADIQAIEKLAPKSPAGSRLLAVYYSKRNKPAEALREADRAIERLKAGGDPDDRPSDLLVMRHFRAELLGRLGRFDEARKDMEALLAGAADDGARVDALVALASLERSAGKPGEAERRVRAAIDSGLKSARLYGALAETLSGAGRPGEAAECWRKAQAIAPGDAYYRLALASLLARDGQRFAAAAELRALLEGHPDHAEALNMLGYLYAQEGMHLDEAAELVGRALTADPKNGHYLDSLGWVRYRQGRAEEALGILERAAMNAPEAIVYEHLGDACYALGLFRRARAAWAKAGALDKDAAGPRLKLERVK